MRVYIYKTDNAPDLTLFLQEGQSLPSNERDKNWLRLKTVTRGEIPTDIASKMAATGSWVERLGRVAVGSPPLVRPSTRRKISLSWLARSEPPKT